MTTQNVALRGGSMPLPVWPRGGPSSAWTTAAPLTDELPQAVTVTAPPEALGRIAVNGPAQAPSSAAMAMSGKLAWRSIHVADYQSRGGSELNGALRYRSRRERWRA